jgi:hypothetical protein
MDAANQRLAAFSRRAKLAVTAAAAGLRRGRGAMMRSGLQVVDAQAKLAQSLGTTVESIQVLARAGDLAGVAMSGIEQATKDLTRRLSQAADGTGPAVDALSRLGSRPARCSPCRSMSASPRSTTRSRPSCRRRSAPRSPASSSARKAPSR